MIIISKLVIVRRRHGFHIDLIGCNHDNKPIIKNCNFLSLKHIPIVSCLDVISLPIYMKSIGGAPGFNIWRPHARARNRGGRRVVCEQLHIFQRGCIPIYSNTQLTFFFQTLTFAALLVIWLPAVSVIILRLFSCRFVSRGSLVSSPKLSMACI